MIAKRPVAEDGLSWWVVNRAEVQEVWFVSEVTWDANAHGGASKT